MRNDAELRVALKAVQGDGEYYEKHLAPAPWAFTVRGVDYLAATNGHLLVLAAGDVTGLPRVPDKRDEMIRAWFDGPDGEQIDVAVLARFANVGLGSRDCAACKNTRERQCGECDGDGVMECSCSKCDNDHEATCDACGGDGTIRCAACADLTIQKPARLLGLTINRQVIREGLEALGVSDGVARLSINAKNIFRLVSDGAAVPWMLVWMPLRDSAPVPRVEFEKPETWQTVAA